MFAALTQMALAWRSRSTLAITSLISFFSSRRRHTRYWRDWSSDVCSSDLGSCLRQAPRRHGLDRAYERVCERRDRRADQRSRVDLQGAARALGWPATDRRGPERDRERAV